MSVDQITKLSNRDWHPESKDSHIGKGENVSHTVRAHEPYDTCSSPYPVTLVSWPRPLVNLYRCIFARILSRGDAKASPYSRYYIATSTPVHPHPTRKPEDGTPQSISIDSLPHPYVRHLRVCSLFFSTTLFPSILVSQGIDLASQHLRGERAKNSG